MKNHIFKLKKAMTAPRRDTPSYYRNIEPILEKLEEILILPNGNFLEIASGSGQHVMRFAKAFPQFNFQPSEYDISALSSIDAWAKDSDNILPAMQLDVLSKNWFIKDAKKYDMLFCANVIHISPWQVTCSLFEGAARNMKDACQIILYGPYKVDGEHTSQGNIEFDQWLKEKDASFGIRDIADVTKEVGRHGFKLHQSHAMPANNYIQVFTRI